MNPSKVRPASHLEVPSRNAVMSYIRHSGIRRTVLRGAYVVVNQLFTVSWFDTMTLVASDMRTPSAALQHLTLKSLNVEEMRFHASRLDDPMGSMLARAASSGDRCSGVLDGEAVVNIALFANCPTPLLNDLVVVFPKQNWYMYGGWTSEKYRGSRLHSHSILEGARRLFEDGVEKLVTVCEVTNYRSYSSAQRMGWRPFGRLSRTAIGPWTRISADRNAKSLGMRLTLRREGEGR